MPLGQKAENENPSLGMRDAFHVACVMCEWDYNTGKVEPGMPVRFTGNSFTRVRPALAGEPIHGIADPFSEQASEDELFWVLLKPGYASTPRHDFDLSVTDVPHEWSCKSCD